MGPGDCGTSSGGGADPAAHYATDATSDRAGVEPPLSGAGGGIAYETTSAELTGAEDYEAGRASSLAGGRR